MRPNFANVNFKSQGEKKESFWDKPEKKEERSGFYWNDGMGHYGFE